MPRKPDRDDLADEYAEAFTDPESRTTAEDWEPTTGDGLD
jgi:hypothetical protein